MCRNHVPVFVTLRWELYDGLSYTNTLARSFVPYCRGALRAKALAEDVQVPLGLLTLELISKYGQRTKE
ncbi:MAG: hypothetical protein KatS3mg058_0446 [Roseiflexus sp.]|nr:MAG: hypothetical protein KatS3mg058_0446 [Roseiflexus sp.]